MSTNSEISEKPKKLLWTAKINRMVQELKTLTKNDRTQYRTDIKAVMCRGIPDKDVSTIKQGLAIENGVFVTSRVYVPINFYMLYRSGVFKETFTFGEAKYIVRIMVFMHIIDCAGHLMMKRWTNNLYQEYVGINTDNLFSSSSRKKQMDDYIIQKSYFKTRKEGKEFNQATNVK